MDFLKIVAVFAFVLMTAKGCELNQALGEKIGMECVTQHSDPSFLMAMASHMDSPDSMAKPTFICHYQKEVINIVMCMKDKLQECIPAEYQKFMSLVPSKERMAEALGFVCDHKEVLQDRCMDANIQNVMECYMGKVSQLKTMAAAETNPSMDLVKKMLCSVVRSEEQCFRTYQGSCSKEYIETVVQALETFFPTSNCPKADLTNTVLGSILVHGAPQGNLKFEPNMYKPYQIIKN